MQISVMQSNRTDSRGKNLVEQYWRIAKDGKPEKETEKEKAEGS